MNLLKCILGANDCFKTKQIIVPKGVMWHSTGANNPNLRRYVQPLVGYADYNELMKLLGTNANGNHWNRPGLDVCVHAFIGKLADGSVATVQTLPWDMRGWHSGSGKKGSANNTHISFEICEDGLNDKKYFEAVYREAVAFTAMLCLEYDLDPMEDGVVIDHSEGYKHGIASGHADVSHWLKKYGKTMDDVRRDIAEEMEVQSVKRYETIKDVPDWGRPTIQKLMDKGALKGTDNKGTIDVDDTYVRIMVTLDRMGKLD